MKTDNNQRRGNNNVQMNLQERQENVVSEGQEIVQFNLSGVPVAAASSKGKKSSR